MRLGQAQQLRYNVSFYSLGATAPVSLALKKLSARISKTRYSLPNIEAGFGVGVTAAIAEAVTMICAGSDVSQSSSLRSTCAGVMQCSSGLLVLTYQYSNRVGVLSIGIAG